MADKKISGLETRTTVLPTDLIPIVGNIAGVPDNYITTANSLFTDVANVVFAANLVVTGTHTDAPSSANIVCKANSVQAANLSTLATHQIKLVFNGHTNWVLASNVAPA